jgi:hypothetical protein
MFFNRKPKETKPLCFHEWRVADFGVTEYYTGVDIDFHRRYVLGCEKCGNTRTVDEFAFYEMRDAGVIKEATE